MSGPNPGGFFIELFPMLNDRTIMMIVAKADDKHLTVSVVPKRVKDDENAALTTPLCCTGTPEELDRELPAQVRDFVGGYVTLSVNLAQIQREREEAEKATREEAKRKTKAVGNGGTKTKAAEPSPRQEPSKSQPAMLNLFEGELEAMHSAPITNSPDLPSSVQAHPTPESTDAS
jgi:PRTRC genetic system protein E